MLMGKVFQPFVEKRPVCVMARGILERLSDPATGAEAVFRRITVKLDQPTRDGDRELHLLSNVPADDAGHLEGGQAVPHPVTLTRPALNHADFS